MALTWWPVVSPDIVTLQKPESLERNKIAESPCPNPRETTSFLHLLLALSRRVLSQSHFPRARVAESGRLADAHPRCQLPLGEGFIDRKRRRLTFLSTAGGDHGSALALGRLLNDHLIAT